MAKLTRTITINAPVEKVFDYMNDPTHMLEIWPNMVEIKDVQGLPNGGVCFKMGYNFKGIRLEGASEDIEYVLNQRTVTKTTGGLEGLTTFIYDPTGTGTRVTLVEEFAIPVPVLGKLAESMVLKMNEHEAEALLANLKIRMEE